jgi:hypothetical protein
LFNIWSTDNNGNYITNLASGISGTSSTLENFETIFHQDLNGNGTIGNSTHATATDVASNDNGSANTNSAVNVSADNFHFSDQGFHFGSHNNGTTGQTPAAAIAANDSFVFAPGSGSAGTAPTANDMPFGNTAFASGYVAPSGNHEDAFSNSAIHDAAHGPQWLAHHGDFHLA